MHSNIKISQKEYEKRKEILKDIKKQNKNENMKNRKRIFSDKDTCYLLISSIKIFLSAGYKASFPVPTQDNC